jgi:hypothetical protein
LTDERVLVELDIFSGRPNPRWQLDEQAATTLRRLHENLWPIQSRAPEPPGLGYRGFIYTLHATTWRAFKGWIASPDQTLIDRSHSVERLLLVQLPEEYAEIRSRVAAEFEEST